MAKLYLTPLNFLITATHSHQSDRCFPLSSFEPEWLSLLVALPSRHILDDLHHTVSHLQRRLGNGSYDIICRVQQGFHIW